MQLKGVATCGFGLESVLGFELKRIGIEDYKMQDGRAVFTTDEFGIARANLWLRTAERVQILLAEFPCSTFDELFEGVKAIPLGKYIARTDAFPVKGYTINSRLTSVPACQSVAKKAAVERLKIDHNSPFLTEKSGVTKMIRFSIVKDVCTIMLDTSGDGLHKRGYRPLTHAAPIKETIAAGIADFARTYDDSLFIDPFCGSGTLLIEAAMKAWNIAPGLHREFVGEKFDFLAEAFRVERDNAFDAIKEDISFRAIGYDIDPEVIENAKQNAKRAGVAGCVEFRVGDARKVRFLENATVVANPPYGERLMTPEEAERLYKDFGANFLSQKARGLYLICSHPEFEKLFGKKADRRRKLYNGMIQSTLYMYFNK